MSELRLYILFFYSQLYYRKSTIVMLFDFSTLYYKVIYNPFTYNLLHVYLFNRLEKFSNLYFKITYKLDQILSNRGRDR